MTGLRRLPPGDAETAVILQAGWSLMASPTSWDTTSSFTGKAFTRLAGPGGALCLRRYPHGTSAVWLTAVHRALAFLVDHGCRFFPAPLATTDGTTVFADGIALYDLTPWAPGVALDPAALEAAHLSDLGRVIATLHRAGRDADGPSVRFDWLTRRQRLTQRLAWDPTPRGRSAAAWQRLNGLSDFYAAPAPRDGPEAREVVTVARAALARLAGTFPAAELAAALPTLTHGDLWSAHVHFAGAAVAALLDADTLARRPPGGDLAALCVDFGGWDAGRCGAILAGYAQVGPVTKATVTALPQLAILRTLGVLRERLRSYRRATVGAARFLGGPVPHWLGQLHTLTALDAAAFARRVLP